MIKMLIHLLINLQVNEAIIKTLSEDEPVIRLLFSTIALGMGCDLRHVKRIIHAGPPSTLEGK